MKVRVRFAPSPTGYLHVGGARSALFNYLFAKKMGGDFILRIEDTDLERSTEESLRLQLADLKWLGLDWNEGPDSTTLKDLGGSGPYRQSQRTEVYRRHGEILVEAGKAYYCFLSDEELDAQKKEAEAKGRPLQINSPHRDLPLAEARKRISQGAKPVIRFRTPDQKRDYVFQDLIRKEVRFPSDMVSDFVLVRSNGMPVYNFCCVIDDHLMGITHVLRAEEHLSNTLRQLMLYEAFGFKIPEIGHMSIILGSDRQKLSKRHGATSVFQFKEQGYLPEAILNFMVLLGWSSPSEKEVMGLEEMISEFSLDRLNDSPAVFDETRLKWFNSQHLRGLKPRDLWQRLLPRLTEKGIAFNDDPAWQDEVIEAFKPYLETLVDAETVFGLIDHRNFSIQKEESKEVLGWESSASVVRAWRDYLKGLAQERMDSAGFEKALDQVKEVSGVKGKFLFMPIRVAVIGKPHGLELKTLVPLIGVGDLIQRAEKTLAHLSGTSS